jgi:uncharacterized membrane protein YphA (DoxX/SURF4 family)
MKHIRIISRILLGLVFIFSGFVKGIDPMGSVIKFSEYFEVFHLTWLDSLTLVLAITMSTAEFLIGVALLTGLRMKVTSWAALLFMSFFLILTLFIAIKNPVTDCGCFGDALVITNWQTFYKNIVLIAFAIFIFYSRNRFVPYASPFKEWLLVIFFAAIGAGISVYCYEHLPIMDFRPYRVGTYIPSKMVMPKGAIPDEYETRLYYERKGEIKEFNLTNFPWQDSINWKFKYQKSVLVKKGYSPPIHGFSITSQANEDITDAVLKDTSYSLIFVAQDAGKVKPAQWQVIQTYDKFSQEHSRKFYVLTSTPQSTTDQIKHENHLTFDFHYTDETALKTMIRANPGLVLLKDGIILNMWHYNDLPKPEYFEGNILSKVLTDDIKSLEWKRILILSFGFVIILVAILGLRKKD